jgi:hypothetical protein
VNQNLGNLKLRDEGLLVLGIERVSGEFIGTPNGDTVLEKNDNVIIYGRDSTLAELSQRHPGINGDVEHLQEVSKTERVRDAEKRLDEAGEKGRNKQPDSEEKELRQKSWWNFWR